METQAFLLCGDVFAARPWGQAPSAATWEVGGRGNPPRRVLSASAPISAFLIPSLVGQGEALSAPSALETLFQSL